MPQRTLPSKLVWERYRLEFDFNTLLELNETVVTWNVFNEVITGIDPDPNEMFTTQKQLLDNVVFQIIRFGLPGVIYGFKCVAITNTGKELELVKKLAVLLSPAIVPPLFGISYSTPPYSALFSDSLDSFGVLTSGLSLDSIVDLIDSNGFITGGSLREPLITYEMVPEAVDSNGVLTGGSLGTPLVTYVMVPEGIDSTGVVNSGTLVTILITYNNWPFEGVDSNGTITGGSLV